VCSQVLKGQATERTLVQRYFLVECSYNLGMLLQNLCAGRGHSGSIPIPFLDIHNKCKPFQADGLNPMYYDIYYVCIPHEHYGHVHFLSRWNFPPLSFYRTIPLVHSGESNGQRD
jgi:hypothetical protein